MMSKITNGHQNRLTHVPEWKKKRSLPSDSCSVSSPSLELQDDLTLLCSSNESDEAIFYSILQSLLPDRRPKRIRYERRVLLKKNILKTDI